MSIENFKYSTIPAEAEALRAEVRAFLKQELSDFPNIKRADSWIGFDAEFSRKLGQRGWVGMSLPKQYGGSEASAFSRYVVIEELLAAGALVHKYLNLEPMHKKIFIYQQFVEVNNTFV